MLGKWHVDASGSSPVQETFPSTYCPGMISDGPPLLWLQLYVMQRQGKFSVIPSSACQGHCMRECNLICSMLPLQMYLMRRQGKQQQSAAVAAAPVQEREPKPPRVEELLAAGESLSDSFTSLDSRMRELQV